MKSLSERIAERTRTKPGSVPNCNRAVVLALRQDIQQARADGWSVLAIYQTLHEERRVTFSYQAFRRYMQQLLPERAEPKAPRKAPQKAATALPAQGMPSLRFNPVPETRELL